MAVNPEHFFKVILAAERSGVIDKIMLISGEALEKFLERTEYDLGDIFNKVDETTSRAVMAIDNVIGLTGPLMRFAANERLLGIASRILDFKIVRQSIIRLFDRIMTVMLEGRSSPSLSSKLKHILKTKTLDQPE